LTETENFFLTYKKLEAKVVATEGWVDLKKALEYLNKTKLWAVYVKTLSCFSHSSWLLKATDLL